MSVRLLAGAAAFAILIGASVAYCQHQGDEQPGPDQVDCVGVMWAAPASTRRSDIRKDPGPQRREGRQEPRKERRAPAAGTPLPGPSVTASPRARGPRADIDVEFGGC